MSAACGRWEVNSWIHSVKVDHKVPVLLVHLRSLWWIFAIEVFWERSLFDFLDFVFKSVWIEPNVKCCTWDTNLLRLSSLTSHSSGVFIHRKAYFIDCFHRACDYSIRLNHHLLFRLHRDCTTLSLNLWSLRCVNWGWISVDFFLLNLNILLSQAIDRFFVFKRKIFI